jgi:hypothetical protein
VAGFSNADLIRVPEVKSIPRFSPLPPIASAPISRIVPDIEKKYFEAPMKSNVQRASAAGAERRGVRDRRERPSSSGSPGSPARR